MQQLRQETAFWPYRSPRFADSEILVRADGPPDAEKTDAEIVVEELRRRFPGVLIAQRERMGIVRLEIRRPGGEPLDVGDTIDKIRRDRAEQGERVPELSPVHTAAVGQPNVVGNSDAVLPQAASGGLPERTGSDGEGVTVAIIDTGIEDHEWLERGTVAMPGDFEEQILVRLGTRDVLGSHAGHGVFLTGLVLQHAPGATVRVYKTANSFGESDIDKVAMAILRAADAGADVINLSLGCFTRRNNQPFSLTLALELLDETVAVVASAGNSAEPSRSFWPAAFPRVTAVGALTGDGTQLAEYTNRGSWVDAYVPADDVLSTYIRYTGDAVYPEDGELRDKHVDYDTGWATWSGTSMAAAIWSGALARAIGIARTTDGLGTTPRETAELLRSGPPEAFDFVLPLSLPADEQFADGGREPRRAFTVAPVSAPASATSA